MRIEPPPPSLPEDVRAYLVRMFKAVDTELNRDAPLKGNTRLAPDMDRPGMLLFFTSMVPGTDITSAGLWFRSGAGWTKVN